MKTLLFVTLISLLSLTIYAQDEEKMKSLCDNEQYQEIIDIYASDAKEYSAKSLYYIGFSYYMLEDDSNCIKYMDLSIDKNPNDPAPYFIKANTLNYMEKFEDAIAYFQKAIELDPEESKNYSGMGDSYYFLEKLEQALIAYKKATEQKEPNDRAFYMIAQIYYNEEQYEKALEAYYSAKSFVSEESHFFQNTLFNIGLLEVLINSNYEKAENIYLELLNKYPNDYHSYAKLIQIYYHQEKYEKASSYKEKLYELSSTELLKDSDLEDMFCFDQFDWNDKRIMAFERYENENKGKIYNKHIFYVTDGNGNIEYTIQTEFSPISVELGGAKYILCAWKDNIHINSGIGFNDDFNYKDLKKEVIVILEK